MELNYVGTKGSNQQQAEPINIPEPGPGNIQTRRPYPRFGNLNINSQALSSEYHALQAKLQKRPSGGFWYLASYTFSRSLTTAPAQGAGTSPTIPDHRTSIFRISWPELWRRVAVRQREAFPWRTRDSWQTRSSAGGRCRASSTTGAVCPSRRRFPATSRTPALADQRPNRIGSGELTNPTVDAWFDKSAFVEPGAVHVRRLRTETSSGPITNGMWMRRCSRGSR